MDYKRKKRGFTLVEVIVTITILGVVTLVALPVITGLKSQFDTSKFKVYQSSLESAGKLFVDANLEDVFGNEESGCAEITYTSLVEKRLLEDISIDGVTCFNGQTFVRARKTGSKIEYETSLYCTQNGNEVYSSVLDGSEACASENTSGPPNITISPSKDINKIYKTNSAVITIKDSSGLSENLKLKYEWRKDSVDGTVESVKEENITIARGKIEHRITVNAPSNKTGNYYLVVTPIDVKDINANPTTDVVSKGPFKLDNSAPKINVKVYKYDGTNKIGDPVMTKTNNANVQITTWSTNGYYFDFSGTTDTGSTKLNELWEWNPTGKVSLDTSLTGNSNATSIKNHTITAPGIRYAKYTVSDEADNKSSITITVYISPTYNIVYGKNGGTGTIANTKCYYGIDCTMTDQKYSRTGYTFTKWKIGDTLYGSSSKVKNLSSSNGANVNANAQWNPITYTLKFNGNGSNSGTVANMTCKYDTTYKLPAATVYKRTGYHFTGFKINNKVYNGGASIKNLTSTNGATLTATAQWLVNSYSIKYDGNGATSGGVSNTICTFGTDCSLAKNGFSRTGYIFGGWQMGSSTFSTASTNSTVKNATSTNNGTVTATAIWIPITYTLKYNGNGATSGSAADVSCKYDKNYTLVSANTFARTGYHFTGFKIGNNTYAGGASVRNLTTTNGSTVTAYAQWAINKYTIKYDGNGASSGSVSNTSCTYGSDCTLANNGFSRTGYTFGGWTINSTTYSAGGKVKNLSSTNGASLTAKAIWKANTYTIKYAGNGSTGGSVSNTTCTYGKDCKLASNGFSRTGYNFTKWKINNSEYNASTNVKNLTATNGGTVTATAQWSIKTYTVSYNNNGGSGAPASQTKKYGTDLTLSSTKPTRSGYEFMGWGTSSSTTTASYSAGGKYTNNSGATLYALWRKKITVNFYRNKAGWLSDQSRSCYMWNAATSCSITSPGINNIGGQNKVGQNYSDVLSVKGWSTSNNTNSASWAVNTSKNFSSNANYYTVINFVKTNVVVYVTSDTGLISRNGPCTGSTYLGTNHPDSYMQLGGMWYDWAYCDSSNPIWVYSWFYSGKCKDNCSGGWSSTRYMRW